MGNLIRAILNLLGGGLLDRILDTVDRKVDADTDREKLKADIIRESYRTRSDFMKTGGFWLMAIFAVPLAIWHGMVIYDSAFGCVDCVFPNEWTVAALPAPLSEWAGLMIVSIFGVIGVTRLRK